MPMRQGRRYSRCLSNGVSSGFKSVNNVRKARASIDRYFYDDGDHPGIGRKRNVQRAIDSGFMASQRSPLVTLNVEKQVNFRTHRQSTLGKQLKILTLRTDAVWAREISRAEAIAGDGHRMVWNKAPQ